MKPVIFKLLLFFLTSDVVINQVNGCLVNITIKEGPVIQVKENQTVLPVTFLRTGNTSISVIITASTHFDTASASDFNTSVKNITFGPNVTSVNENFMILDDMKVENHVERFFINISSADPSVVCTPHDSIIIQIIDDDTVEIGFHRDFRNFSENVGNISIEFYKKSNGTEIPLTARYFTPGIGNATIDIDYKNASSFITFKADESTVQEPNALTIIDNNIVEDTKCFNVSMDATHPNIMIPRQSMICILNDDKVTIEFRHTNLSVEEDDGNVSVPIIKTGKSDIPITIRLTMSEDYNTAEKNVDYVSRHGQLMTFNKDVSEIFFNVEIKNDGQFESTESFFIGIEAVDSSTTIIGSKNLAIVRITDRIDNEINLQKQRQIEDEQKRRTVLMTYLLYAIMAILVLMIITFIFLILVTINKLKKYDKL